MSGAVNRWLGSVSWIGGEGEVIDIVVELLGKCLEEIVQIGGAVSHCGSMSQENRARCLGCLN